MTFLACVSIAALAVVPVFSQKSKAEEDLETLRNLLANPRWTVRVSVSELIEDVRTKGIVFDVGKRELGMLLQAGAAGNRDPGEVAELILACLAACEQCRSRSVSPMSKEEIKTLTEWKFSEEAILRQARARGVKDIEPTASGVAELRKAGAFDGLIRFLIPDDRLVAPGVPGYRSLVLKRAAEYDISAERGWLKVTAMFPAKSYQEFIFKHNSLFHKTVDSEDISEITAYFNQPAPRSTAFNLVEFKVEFDPPFSPQPQPAPAKPRRSKKTPTPLIETSPELQAFYEPQSSGGFNQFRIAVNNNAPAARVYTVRFSWRVLAVPKAAPR